MSTARSTPKLRMVRSCTTPVVVDGQALARDPSEGLVGGADAVGPQHDLVERLAARHPDVDPRLVDERRRPAAGHGVDDGDLGLATESRGNGRGFGPPGGAESGRGRRTGQVDLLDGEIERVARAKRVGDARRTGDAHDAAATGVDADGDRRPLGPEPRAVLAGQQDEHRADRGGRRARRAAAVAGDGTLAPKAPPLATGDAGSPPGSHHEASVSR